MPFGILSIYPLAICSVTYKELKLPVFVCRSSGHEFQWDSDDPMIMSFLRDDVIHLENCYIQK